MSIGSRLRESREALGITQSVLAAELHTTNRTVQNWEHDVSSPPAEVLAAMANLGLDIRYVVTGKRDYQPPPPLTAEEQTLLDRWREASRDTKNAVMGALLGVSASRPRTVVRQNFAGPVGQVTTGDSHISGGTINVGADRKRKR